MKSSFYSYINLESDHELINDNKASWVCCSVYNHCPSCLFDTPCCWPWILVKRYRCQVWLDWEDNFSSGIWKMNWGVQNWRFSELSHLMWVSYREGTWATSSGNFLGSAPVSFLVSSHMSCSFFDFVSSFLNIVPYFTGMN